MAPPAISIVGSRQGNVPTPTSFLYHLAHCVSILLSTIILTDLMSMRRSFCCVTVGSLTDQTEQRLFVQQQLDAERSRAETAEKQRYLQESFVDIGQQTLYASRDILHNILTAHASSVSHELRNPISAIIQSADLLTFAVARFEEILGELFQSTALASSQQDANLQKLVSRNETELCSRS